MSANVGNKLTPTPLGTADVLNGRPLRLVSEKQTKQSFDHTLVSPKVVLQILLIFIKMSILQGIFAL